MPLNQSFYKSDSLTLAQKLLGCELVNSTVAGAITKGIIVETEAYSELDEASHSFRGKTKRNAVMFGPAGQAYIYFTYGMHYCFNVVAGDEGMAEAVLIRALQPSFGIEHMEQRRQTTELYNLCSGPGKLVQAMGILPSQNGASILAPPLYIMPRHEIPITRVSPRIGITRAADKPWRFFIANNAFITKHKFNKTAVPLEA